MDSCLDTLYPQSANRMEPCEPDIRARERQLKGDVNLYREHLDRLREHQECCLERHALALIALKSVIEAQQAIIKEHERYRNCSESYT